MPPLSELLTDRRLDALGLLIEAHHRLVGRLSSELEESVGIPLHWYELLLRLGRSEGHLSMGEIANALALTSGGATRLVDRVIEAGLVERQACPSDRRVWHVALTPRGEEVLQAATRVHLEGLGRHLTRRLAEPELEGLMKTLAKLR